MRKDFACSICSVFEQLQLPTLGAVVLMLGGVVAMLSLVAWPLLFVWPVLFVLGFALAAGHGACAECKISLT